MAKIKLNSLLADLRGRLGSCVFSSNATGFFVSQPKVGRQPRTPAQQTVRSGFSFLCSMWNSLSVEDKDLWRTYAERPDNERSDWFGDPYYPSNRSQFVSLNMSRLYAGEDPTETPPTSDLPAALPSMTGMFSSLNDPVASYIDNVDDFDASIEYVHVLISAWPRPGRLSPVLPAKFLGIIPVSYFGPVDISPITEELFPLGNLAGRWYMEMRSVSADFRMSAPITLSAAFDEEG
jgi:hypothetical protein